MHFSTLALFSLASMALAAPAEIKKPASGKYVEMCTGKDFNNECVAVEWAGSCVNLDKNLNDHVLSLKPADGLLCQFYKEKDCDATKDSFKVDTAGWWNLRKVMIGGKGKDGGDKTKNFGKKLSSFKCDI